MDWTYFMNFVNVGTGLVVIEGTLLLSLLITLVLIRRMMTRLRAKESSLLNSHQIGEWVRESEAICQRLSENLEEKKAIVRRLMSELDEKIRTFEGLLKEGGGGEGRRLSRDGEDKDLGDQVCDLVNTGCDVSEISRRLHLSKGEVELILDLKRYGEAPRSSL